MEQRDLRADLDLAEMLSLDIFQALSYLKTQGVPHRDIKTSNVLLSCECSEPSPTDCGCIKNLGCRLSAKLCDFGLAKLDVFAEASSSNMAGTMAYMAPERFHWRETRRMIPNEVVVSTFDYFASDVYSAALVTWEMYVYAQTGTYTKARSKQEIKHLLGREDQRHMSAPLVPSTSGDTSICCIPSMDALCEHHASLLWSCLGADPSTRPRAENVVRVLRAMTSAKKKRRRRHTTMTRSTLVDMKL